MIRSTLLRSGRRMAAASAASSTSASTSFRWMSTDSSRDFTNTSFSDGMGESIPDEFIEEEDETEGEWMGCSRKFLAPISVGSRGSGMFYMNLVHLQFCHVFMFTSLTYPTPQKYHIIYNTEILNNPLFNKFTAFKGGERDRLRFRGLLPPRRVNMQIQKERVLQEIRAEDSMIRKHTILEEVHDRNETLYHRILVDHM